MSSRDSQNRNSGSHRNDSESLSPETIFAIARHEILGPVHTLQAFLNVLLREQAGPLTDIQRDFISSMIFITRRLERLSHDLHLMLEEGETFRIDSQPIDMLELVGECYREIKPVAASFDINMEFVADRNANWKCHSDPVRIAQITVNLLENAVRNALQGSTVRLRMRQSPTTLLLAFENSVDDLSESDVATWFTPFYRGEISEQRGPHGLGVGLSLVAQLVSALDGQIVTRTSDRMVTVAVRLPR